MGTKKPSCTLLDPSSNTNMPDHKLQPGGRISRDPSPRPGMTTHSERQRDGNREENRRRESDTVKMRDKTRHGEMETLERYYEKDRAPAPRPREGEREWRERERRQDDRSRNGRLLSNMEESERHAERRAKKGDTFPRMRKGVADHNRSVISTSEMAKDRGDRRERPQRTETDKWENDRERTGQREKYREKERGDTRSGLRKESENHRGRPGEDERLRQRERYQESDVFQERRRKEVDSRDIGDRDTLRKRDQLRPNVSDREARIPSPYGKREKKIYVDKWDREKAKRREGKRDTRSEGDSDERELRKERVRDREREEFIYQQSKSEGDSRDKSGRDGDQDGQEGRPRYEDGEGDGSRRKGVEKERYREVDRHAARPADREADRWRDRDYRPDRVLSDRREDDRHRDRRDGERREREADHRRRDDVTGRSSRSPNESSSRVPPRAQSSGEWSSDMDSDARYRRDRDSYEEREGRRRKEEQRDPERGAERGQRPQPSSERRDGDRGGGSEQEQRRMWFDPRMGKNSKEEVADRDRRKERRKEEERSVDSQGKQERVKEESDEKYLGHRHYSERDEYRGGTERESCEVSVDEEQLGEIWRGKGHLSDSDGGIEGSWRRDADRENMTNYTEESDREEEGGSDDWARSESEGGSEAGCKLDRDRMLSGEDGFVTVSSGGDEDYERETDEDEFKDCQEFLEGGSTHEDGSPVGSMGQEEDEREEQWTMRGEERVDEEEEEEEGREKQPKYVFCVIGQTLPRSGAEKSDPSSEDHHHGSDDTQQTEDDLHLKLSGNNEGPAEADIGCRAPSDLRDAYSGEETRSQAEHPRAEMGSLKRDSQTERLLKEWRERNKELGGGGTSLPSNPYGEVGSPLSYEQIQPLLDQLASGAMSPEEVEAIRIRMSGAWSMSEEPKRHSQAPHLKWAKNVVREILGHSDEKIVDETNAEAQEDQGIKQGEIRDREQRDEVAQGTEGMPVFKVTADEQPSEPDLEEDELLEVEGLRGMGQSQTVMHADQFTAMHVVTPAHTHADTLLDTEGKEDRSTDKLTTRPGQVQSEEADVVLKMEEDRRNEIALTEAEAKREKEVKMFLSVSNTLYKPNSCPILNYECEGDSQEEKGGQDDSEEQQQGEELEGRDAGEDTGRMAAGETVAVDSAEGEVAAGTKAGTLASSCSFRDLGPEARLRRRGIRKTAERRRNGGLVQVEEEEGVGRDRRTRIFSTTDDEDDRSKSWGEVDLRSVLETINKQKRNSRFFNAAQLYQQYNEEAQNFEILRQSRSDVLSVCEDTAASPAPSPPPARRPLPPLPSTHHSFSVSHTDSITSAKSLPLPETPKSGGRSQSPRLSISLTQSASLWRDLPAVRNSTELEDLTEDQRRLQEVRFEVVTSEASYCRSLDIVVEHFVKSKQLGSLLTTQDRNWLFSRLADVRAISHSFLSKLEERVESDMMHFAVCDIIARQCQRFKMVYVPYLTNQSYQDATYQRLMNENPGFKRIVEKLERSPVCQRLPLRSFLVLPFQRITRIKLLVQNIVKRTTPGTPEAMHAIKALKLLEKLIQESNDSITEMKGIESLVSLNAKVDFECRTLPLISQSRRLVREGPVTELMDFSLKDTERSVYIHLFNDYLLLSLQKEGGRFTVIDHSPVSNLRVENCRVKLHSLQKNLFRLHMSKKALLLRTDTQSDKLRWISALSRPHSEIDFSAAQDFEQMQCIRSYVAQQPDEMSTEKADVILVHQQSSDNWVEGTRLSDRHRGWIPKTHLETISSSRVKQRNLSDALKLTTATAAV